MCHPPLACHLRVDLQRAGEFYPITVDQRMLGPAQAAENRYRPIGQHITRQSRCRDCGLEHLAKP